MVLASEQQRHRHEGLDWHSMGRCLCADFGADAAQYEDMIAEVEATYVPPEPEPEPVPQQITSAQGKAALIMQGLWGAVLDYVASMQDPTQRALSEVALNDTLTWERSSPFLNAAAAGLIAAFTALPLKTWQPVAAIPLLWLTQITPARLGVVCSLKR